MRIEYTVVVLVIALVVLIFILGMLTGVVPNIESFLPTLFSRK